MTDSSGKWSPTCRRGTDHRLDNGWKVPLPYPTYRTEERGGKGRGQQIGSVPVDGAYTASGTGRSRNFDFDFDFDLF
jgi:hypothetical protein